MYLRSDHFDNPMRFERAVNLLVYHAVLELKSFKFEVRTNAKLLNPHTGFTNIRINVKKKKKADGVNEQLSRPDCEIEDEQHGLWIVIDAKFYNSKQCPSSEEIIKDIKCRYRRKPQYCPTVGLLVFSEGTHVSAYMRDNHMKQIKERLMAVSLKTKKLS